MAEDQYPELTKLLCEGINGNRGCYRQFLQEITPIIRRMVGAKLPAADSEDVVQEVLISVHKASHTFDGQRPVMPWLAAIVQFRIKDHLRKLYANARRDTVCIDDISEAQLYVTESASEHESIDELLKDVPDREKRILTMMHVEGYTAKETGERLGMKESAVKVAAHRAMKKIRDAGT